MPSRKVGNTPACADDAAAWNGQPLPDDRPSAPCEGTLPDVADLVGSGCKTGDPADAGDGSLEGDANVVCINCGDVDVASNMTPAIYDENDEAVCFRCEPCYRELRNLPSIDPAKFGKMADDAAAWQRLIDCDLVAAVTASADPLRVPIRRRLTNACLERPKDTASN